MIIVDREYLQPRLWFELGLLSQMLNILIIEAPILFHWWSFIPFQVGSVSMPIICSHRTDGKWIKMKKLMLRIVARDVRSQIGTIPGRIWRKVMSMSYSWNDVDYGINLGSANVSLHFS